MKTNLVKKLISFVVVICLIATFAPVSFASAAESDALVYSFMQSAYDSSFKDAAKIDYSNGYKNIQYFGSENSTGGKYNDMDGLWDGTGERSLRLRMYEWGRNNNTYFDYAAFRIKGINFGEYKLTLQYAVNKNGANSVNIYILDAETTAKVIAGEIEIVNAIKAAVNSPVLAEINMNDAESQRKCVNTNYIADGEGEHLLVFTRAKAGNGLPHFFPQVITLEPVANKIEYNTSASSSIDASKLTYGTTGGRIEYYDTTSNNTTKFGSIEYVTDDFNGYISFLNAGSNRWTAFKIRIPEAGDYKLDLIYGKHSTATKGAMYLLPVSATTDIESALNKETPVLASVDFYDAESNATSGLKTGTVTVDFTAPSAGEYYMVWKNLNPSSWNKGNAMRPARLTLTGGNLCLIYADISLNKTTFEKNDVATITQGKVFLSNGKETDATGVFYKSTNEAVAKIDGTTVTATGYGIAKIQAVREDGYVLDEETITVKSRDLEEAFSPIDSDLVEIPDSGVTVNIYAYSIDGEVATVNASENVTPGEAVTVIANDVPGYSFLYWAKGTMVKKQVVSYAPEYSFIPTVEATHLIAVYEPTDASETAKKAEFYNGNGQLITSNTTGEFPELPNMAGYGEATAWKCYNDGELYDGSENATLSGTMIFVAQYDDLEKDINVTVSGGTGSGSYSYGDVVTCVANGSGTFKCWTKDDVIVSTDKTYTFNAWESCDVKAIYSDFYFTGKAMKILVDVFNGNFIMAEFIGFENDGNIAEKGIMIGNMRHAMQTSSTQFTIEANNEEEASSALGYVIFVDGTMIKDK